MLKRFAQRHVTRRLTAACAVPQFRNKVTAISPKELQDRKAEAKIARPLSPHVTIYAFPFAALASITHRVTGCVVAGGFVGMGILGLCPMTGLIPSIICAVKGVPAVYLPLKALTGFSFCFHSIKSLFILNVKSNVAVADMNKIGQVALGASALLTVGVMFV